MTSPATILAAAALLVSDAADPRPRKLGMAKSRPYSAKQWNAMKKRRKAARASRRRNRRG